MQNWVSCLYFSVKVVFFCVCVLGGLQGPCAWGDPRSVYITRLLSSHEIRDQADRQREQSERIWDFTGLILRGAAAVRVLRFIHAISVRESAPCLICMAVTLTASHVNLKATTPWVGLCSALWRILWLWKFTLNAIRFIIYQITCVTWIRVYIHWIWKKNFCFDCYLFGFECCWGFLMGSLCSPEECLGCNAEL